MVSIGDSRKRKTRSDKKRDIKPFVSTELKDSIYRLAFITSSPVKDVCEALIVNSIYGNKDIIQELSRYFKRGIRINNTYFTGNLNNETLYSVVEKGENERISFRAKSELYEILSALSYAFDCSVSRVSAVLLYESIIDSDFIEKRVDGYLNSLDSSRKKELKQLLKYIRAETNESYSLVDLLAHLVDEPLKWILPND